MQNETMLHYNYQIILFIYFLKFVLFKIGKIEFTIIIFCISQRLKETQKMSSQLVQYVIVRTDLITRLKWPVGAVIAQACHATTAVNHLFYNHKNTQEYFIELDSMHKVCLSHYYLLLLKQ